MNHDTAFDRIEAQNRGYDAYRAKIKLRDNPYLPGDIKAELWTRGWLAGCDERHASSETS